MTVDLDFLTIESIMSFLLAMFRVQGFFLVAPIFSRSYPMMVKIGVSGVIVLWFSDTIFTSATRLIALDPYGLTISILHELVIGFLLGLLINLIFDVIVSFAHLLGIQMGQSSANVFNPATQSQNNTSAAFFGTVTLMIFLTIGGIYHMVYLLKKSFMIIPLASFQIDFVELAMNYRGLFGQVFLLGLKLLLPLIAFMFVFDVFVAIFSRILPQASMFFLFMPIKIILGAFVIMTILGFYYGNIEHYFEVELYQVYDSLFK